MSKFLAAANPRIARRHQIFSGAVCVGTGGYTLARVFEVAQKLVPSEYLERVSNSALYGYAALAIAFITALPLFITRKVITVSLAQAGAFVSLVYVAYSLAGVFVQFNKPVFFIVVSALILVMAAVLWQGVAYLFREGTRSDVVLSLLLLLGVVVAAVYPMVNLWSIL